MAAASAIAKVLTDRGLRAAMLEAGPMLDVNLLILQRPVRVKILLICRNPVIRDLSLRLR